MLYGVVVDVINILTKVGLIANLVLPKSPLPDGLFPFALARDGLSLLVSLGTSQTKPGFDAFPSGRKISVTFGQSPDAVDVIG